jgi:hypothetical protein
MARNGPREWLELVTEKLRCSRSRPPPVPTFLTIPQAPDNIEEFALP